LQDIVSGSCQSPAETFTCPNHSVAHQRVYVEKKPASILIAANAFQANPLSTITSKQTKNEPHSTASPAQFTTL